MQYSSIRIVAGRSQKTVLHKKAAVTVLATVFAVIVGCGQTPGGKTGAVVPTEKSAAKQHTDIASDKLLQIRQTEQVKSAERSARKPVDSLNTVAATGTRSMVAADSLAALAHRPVIDRVLPDPQTGSREHYLDFDDNPVKQVSVEPVSTFSIDVDTAAYSNMRRMIAKEGRLPPKDAVRIEEMINYFSYQYQQPPSTTQPFTVTTEVAPAPWNDQRHLLRIGLQGYQLPPEQRPAANLVFLVDVSGSMRAPDKLPVVKNSLRLLVNKMTANDQIALVAYAGAAGVVLEPTAGSDKSKILNAIDRLQAGGSTHGSAGIKLAYQLAREHFIAEGINRVLIASDGDMNVGTVSIDALVELVERERKSGVQLSTLGFGTGNYNYSLMEQLADNGNGTASYIDNLKEAQKVLVSEIQSTLLTIARDVKIQIEFNPESVAEYRLIGYENRVLAAEDFKNDKVDAGDIGAGHSVTAFYEITLHGSDATRIDPLRYQAGATALSSGHADAHASSKTVDSATLDKGTELAHIKLRYKQPHETQSIQLDHTVKRNQVLDAFESASADFRFASAVAGFGQYLRGGKYNENAQLADMLTILKQARGGDEHGYRSEFISLVELTSSLAGGGNAGAVNTGNGG